MMTSLIAKLHVFEGGSPIDNTAPISCAVLWAEGMTQKGWPRRSLPSRHSSPAAGLDRPARECHPTPHDHDVNVVHALPCSGAVEVKYRLPSHNATCTKAISTGTSTKGPMTVAKATGEASPNAAMPTAMASSKLLLAAVKASAVVRG